MYNVIQEERYMKKTPTSIPFKGTPEQEAKLKAIIEERKHIDGCLMQIMQEAQEIYGYLRRAYER